MSEVPGTTTQTNTAPAPSIPESTDTAPTPSIPAAPAPTISNTSVAKEGISLNFFYVAILSYCMIIHSKILIICLVIINISLAQTI